MIKAFAVILMIALTGSSISEFSLSPRESFTLHFNHDYVFMLSECSPQCVSLKISQMTDGRTTWTGQLFNLQQGLSYPSEMSFDDVIFEAVYVVSIGDTTTLRVSYREPTPLKSQERLVKATSEKETAQKIPFVIIGETCVVIFLVFFVAHRMLRKPEKRSLTRNIPGPVVGFHDDYFGIPRHDEEDPDLELLQQMRELETLKEMEMRQRMRRREEEEDNLGLDWI